MKWKGDVLDKRVTELYGDQPCYRLIGYDCSPKDNKRFNQAVKKQGTKSRLQDWAVYPLQDFGLTREDCVQTIDQAGLPQPGISSCYFCSSMKSAELDRLTQSQLKTIVLIEANAQPNLRTVKGLWMNRRMTDYIRDKALLPEAEIDHIWRTWSTSARPIADQSRLAETIVADFVGEIVTRPGDTLIALEASL